MDSGSRFWEIDFARGAAVVGMVLFNWLFALGFFGLIAFDASQGFWWAFARLVGGAFVLISGVAFSLRLGKMDFRRKAVAAGLKLFALGLGITVATALFVGRGTVVFGILHFLGVAWILAIAFAGRSWAWLSAAGAAVVAAGVLLSSLSFSFPWLLWLGFVPRGFYSLDFFPLLPWFGVFLLGMALGKKFYGCTGVAAASEPFYAKPLVFLGRHSLFVYLAHQPLLIALLYAAGFSPLSF